MEENKSITPPPFVKGSVAPPAFIKPKPACINKGRPVWISYVVNSNEKPEWEHIADCVDKLVELFEANNIEYQIDTTSESDPYISDFERRIGWDSEVIVLVFSDRYFHSLHSMFEFVQIKNAVKKYPYKHLFCVKSGDFNLSNINYILDLEHYWGDQKQEYEEVQLFHSRALTNVEHEAYKNGFYMNEIRSLYSFFSTINYVNAFSVNYNDFLKEIVKCYTSVSKFSKQIRQKIKDRQTHLKFMGCGCLTWILIPFLVFALAFFLDQCTINVTTDPVYSKSPEGFKITSIEKNLEFTILNCQLQNTHDHDTIVYASLLFYLVADGKYYPLQESNNIPMFHKYRVLSPQDSMSFTLLFPLIPNVKTFDLELTQGIGVYDIHYAEEE